MPDPRFTRREFVRTLSLGAGAALVVPGFLPGCAPLRPGGRAPAGGDAWSRVPEILARIRPPTFPARDFPVTAHGGVGDGRTDNTAAFRRSVEACAAAGGGRVVVPAGRFLTGPIHLKSNVNLHVSEGAVIAFSQDPKDYLPVVMTRWEGMEMMGYSPLVYAYGQENVAVTGKGTLDGQASTTVWWPWKGKWKQHPEWDRGPTQKAARDRLFELAEQGVPVERRVFAEGSYLRPQFIQPYRCRNVLIEGVTLVNAPMWQVNPVLCQNVMVRSVSVVSHGPNNDGCNPESCRDVLIEGCLFDTGDDCIAIKSGRNADGRRIGVPSENVVVRNCRMKDGHGGVTLGSEISGGVRNVFVEECEMDSPNLDRALRFKNNAMRGGVLENVYMRNVRIGQVKDAVVSVDLHYEEGQQGPYVPVVRNVELRNVTSRKSTYGLYMRAYPRSEISDVRVIGCRFDGVARGNVTEGVEDLEFEDTLINGRPASATSHQAQPKADADLLPSDRRLPAPPRPRADRGMRHPRTLRPLAAALLALAPLAAALPAPAARAQVAHVAAGTGHGEGTRQPDDAPLAIPHAPPRLRPSHDGRPWSVRMAGSVMRRSPQTHRRWDYTQGVVLGAIERVALAKGDTAMLAYVKANMDRWVKRDGSIEGYELEEYNIDEVAQGRLLFGLYERTKDARYRRAADRIREQLRTHPRTAEGGFWHKKIYPQQMWLDGLYMGQPFYAQYAKTFGEPAVYDDVAKQFLLVARRTRDPRTGLMYHAWDAAKAQPWADTATGLSPHFWGRAMGWYAMGVVETLDHFPADHPDRAAVIRTLADAAEGIALTQDPVTGLWWDVMDQPNRAGNYLEASASSMFAYALAKAARLGYVDPKYRQVAERAFGGLLSNLVRENPDGTMSLVNVVQVSGLGGNPRRDGSYRDGSYAYYVSEPVVTDDYKGVGPFILAALELGR